VGTAHASVQGPVHHRQSHAQNPFSCALSGVHRTGTVDCPVRHTRFLKNLSLPEPEARLHFSSLATASLCLWRFPPSPAISPPRRRSSGDPVLSTALFSGETPLVPYLSLYVLHQSEALTHFQFHLLIQIPISIKSCESKCMIESLYVP
jgi:hypothetical protein